MVTLLSNGEGVGTERKLLLARIGKYLFKNETHFCDVMNSDTLLDYIKTNAFRGFLFGRKALFAHAIKPNLESAGGQEKPFAQFLCAVHKLPIRKG